MDSPNNIFPFCDVTNDELAEYFWDKSVNGSNHINQTLVFNFLDKICVDENDNNFVQLSNAWSPSDCKYVTSGENIIARSKFSVLQINCRSLPKNFISIELLLTNLIDKPTVICLSETWLNNENCNYYNIPGYNFYCKNRQNKLGGGVAIYVSKYFESYEKVDLTNDLNSSCESIAIDVFNKSVKYTIVSMYRPPSGDLRVFNSNLSLFLENNSGRLAQNVVIAADFNIDLLKVD